MLMKATTLYLDETMKKAFVLYRRNFGALLRFALVNALCGLPMTLSSLLFPQDRTEAQVIGGLLTLVLMVTVNMKNELGAQFYLADAMAAGSGGEMPTMKSAYAKTKGRAANLFGNYILLLLLPGVCMLFIALAVVILSFNADIDEYLVPWIMLPGMIPIGLIYMPKFFLITPMVAFEEEESPKLTMISRMTKGNFVALVMAALVTTGISTAASFLLGFFASNTVAATVISAVVAMLIFGFAHALALMAYQTLRPKPEARDDARIVERCSVPLINKITDTPEEPIADEADTQG